MNVRAAGLVISSSRRTAAVYFTRERAASQEAKCKFGSCRPQILTAHLWEKHDEECLARLKASRGPGNAAAALGLPEPETQSPEDFRRRAGLAEE